MRSCEAEYRNCLVKNPGFCGRSKNKTGLDKYPVLFLFMQFLRLNEFYNLLGNDDEVVGREGGDVL